MPDDEDVRPDRVVIAAVCATRLHQLGRRDRPGQPPAVRLASDLQHLARHRDGIPAVTSPFTSGRAPSRQMSLRQVRRRADLVTWATDRFNDKTARSTC
jgi:hypothetical protein